MHDIQVSYHYRWQGFTLIEMLIALALMGILAAWGLPNFQALKERSAITSEVNRIQTALTLARNTAITRDIDTTVCPVNNSRNACLAGADSWGGEWVVFVGRPSGSIPSEDIVRFFPAIAGATSTSKTHVNASYLSYNSQGRVIYGARTLEICPTQKRADQQGKEVFIHPFGRARVGEDPINCSY